MCFLLSVYIILFGANSLLSSWKSSTTPGRFRRVVHVHHLSYHRNIGFKGIQNSATRINTDVKLQLQRRRLSTVSFALAETAASMAVAVTVVGAAATLLVKRSKTSESTQIQFKVCEDCGGSGICSECKGEGFVLRKRSDESAEKSRVQAKNMATRFTAGLPKKWSYCTKCSSGRSCSTCSGSGKLSY